MGFGLVTGFIEHLQIVTTRNCSAIANSHSTIHYITHWVFSVCCIFTGCCLVIAANAVASSASVFTPSLASDCLMTCSQADSHRTPTSSSSDWLNSQVSQSVKLLLAFTSAVISGFSLLEVHDQDFYSLLDMYMFQKELSSHTGIFLCVVSMDCIENTAPHCCSSIVTMGTCLFGKPLQSNGCWIFSYSAVVA
jgi:hypothetical protein